MRWRIRAFCDGALEEVLEWYRRGVEAGDAEAMYSLGAFCQRREQHAEAMWWFRRAADAGHADGDFVTWQQLAVEAATADEDEGDELDDLRRRFVDVEDDQPLRRSGRPPRPATCSV
jgi:TPR repeat protein